MSSNPIDPWSVNVIVTGGGQRNKYYYCTDPKKKKNPGGGVFEFAREGGRGPRHSNGNFTMNDMLLIFPGGPDPPDQTIPSRSVHATGRIKKKYLP